MKTLGRYGNYEFHSTTHPLEAHHMSNDTPTVEGTISALESGVTNIPLDAALANIQGWQTTLEASDDTTLQALAAQLGELATVLQAETIDLAEVSSLLSSLGEGTTAAAGGDAQLTNLGSLLTQVGGSLGR